MVNVSPAGLVRSAASAPDERQRADPQRHQAADRRHHGEEQLAADLPGVEFEVIGPVELKGLIEPLVLYQAMRRAPAVS